MYTVCTINSTHGYISRYLRQRRELKWNKRVRWKQPDLVSNVLNPTSSIQILFCFLRCKVATAPKVFHYSFINLVSVPAATAFVINGQSH